MPNKHEFISASTRHVRKGRGELFKHCAKADSFEEQKRETSLIVTFLWKMEKQIYGGSAARVFSARTAAYHVLSHKA